MAFVVIIGKVTQNQFHKKNIVNQKQKHLRLKAIILELGIIWLDLKEKRNVILRNNLC